MNLTFSYKINLFQQHILTMTEEEFHTHKESLAIRRLEKPKQMTALSAIFWSEITSQQYNFDRANIEVAYLRTITQEQILKFYKVHIITLFRQTLICVKQTLIRVYKI